MKKLSFILLSFVVWLVPVAANDLSLEDIMRGAYAARGVSGIRPLADGEHYARTDGHKITTYSFQTGAEESVLFDVANTKGDVRIEAFSDYIMSPDEQTILIQTRRQPIYRHSATAVYYIYNVRNRTLVPLSDGGPQEVPAFSPAGTMIAFVRQSIESGSTNMRIFDALNDIRNLRMAILATKAYGGSNPFGESKLNR